MTPRRNLILRRARIGLYVVAAAAVLYLSLRFDVTGLPTEGCTPVRDIPPGSRLVVDLHASTLFEGDAVLFRAADDELLLGLVGVLPPTAPETFAERVGAGELWIVADNESCPARDSRALGPIPRDRVVGKVFLSL
ncbi:MAG: hypothetical protein AAF682_23925 [Planctomycetota bacterium]